MSISISKNFYDISVIPKNWKEKKLKYILSISENKSSNSYDENILSLTKKGIIVNDISSNKGQMAESYEKYIKVKKGQICMNPMDLLSGWVDICAVEGLISPAYYTFELNEEVENKFINYFLQSNYLRKTFFTLCKGVASHDNFGRWVLTPEELKNISIFIPNIDEQKNISRYLDKKIDQINSLIENIQKKIKLLEEKKTSVINEVVTKGLNSSVKMRDSGVKWIGNMPSHWKESQFKFYIKLRHGYQFRDRDFTNDGIKIVKITQLDKEGFLNLSNCSTINDKRLKDFKNILIKENDILMCLTGGTIGKIIKVGKIDEPLLQNYRVGHFSPIDKEKINNDYIFYLMSSEVINEQIFYNIRETGQPNIGMEDMNMMKICIPPISEQEKIASYLYKHTQLIDKTISKEKKRIQLLNEYYQSLVSSVVCGKIRVLKEMI